MQPFGRYRYHAEALLTISRKFEELSAIDADNSDLLAECAAGLTAMAEALVLESQGEAMASSQIH